MTRYVLHICCLDNHISGTGQMRAWTNPMPYAHNVSLTKEVPEFWKNWLEFSNIASTPFEVVCVLMPWKASEEKIHRLSLTTATNISNRLVDWLGGLVGSNLALLAGFSFRIIFPPLSPAKSEKQINLDKTLSEPSHIYSNHLKSMPLPRPSLQGALFDECLSAPKWLQKSGWHTNWTLFKKNTKRKMHGKHVVISFRLWKPWGCMVATL